MKLDQLINKLQTILEQEGNLEVFDHDLFDLNYIQVKKSNEYHQNFDFDLPEKFLIVTSI